MHPITRKWNYPVEPWTAARFRLSRRAAPPVAGPPPLEARPAASDAAPVTSAAGEDERDVSSSERYGAVGGGAYRSSMAQFPNVKV